MKVLSFVVGLIMVMGVACSESKDDNRTQDPNAEFSDEDIKLMDEGGLSLESDEGSMNLRHRRARLTRAERRAKRCSHRLKVLDRIFGKEKICNWVDRHPKWTKYSACGAMMVEYCTPEDPGGDGGSGGDSGGGDSGGGDSGGGDGGDGGGGGDSGQDGGDTGDGQDGGDTGDGSGGGTGGF